MPKLHPTSELELRLSREVMTRVEGKERFDATDELLRRHKKALDESFARHARSNEDLKRSLIWLARILFIPLTVLAIGYLFLVSLGLYSGEIQGISKYSKKTVFLQNEPVLFWITVAYHSCIALFLNWTAYHCGRGTKWFTRTPPNTKIDCDASGARH